MPYLAADILAFTGVIAISKSSLSISLREVSRSPAMRQIRDRSVSNVVCEKVSRPALLID
jgi:hypothetical protein